MTNTQETIELDITGLSYNGLGVGKWKDNPVFVLGAFPEERVQANIFGEQQGVFQAVVSNIITSSPHRITPHEDHYLITSPWQVIDYEYEQILKKDIAKNIYQEVAGIDIGGLDIIFNNRMYAYRNAIEYNVDGEVGSLRLGLFKRGRESVQTIESSELVYPWVHQTALNIIELLNAMRTRASDVKRIVVRSNRLKETVVVLYITNKSLDMSQLNSFSECNGVLVYFSDPKSIRLEKTILLHSYGDVVLTEMLNGVGVMYGPTDFFQINIPIFEKVLQEISAYVKSESIIDYYSGVGAIALAVKDVVRNAILVESNKSAIRTAQKNIQKLGLDEQYHAIAARSEDMLNYISTEKVLILDPPREGCDAKLIKKILEIKPKRIIYLSCKPYTQARDIKMLLSTYKIKDIKLYNFFPRTNHIESLAVLEK